LRIGFHFPWRNTVTRQLAHIFCTVANLGTPFAALIRPTACASPAPRSERSGRLEARVGRANKVSLGKTTSRIPTISFERKLLCHLTESDLYQRSRFPRIALTVSKSFSSQPNVMLRRQRKRCLRAGRSLFLPWCLWGQRPQIPNGYLSNCHG
jgi:hypothetical protein